MPGRYRLQLETPAQGFVDSLPLGNGVLGTTLRGGIGTERFDLNVDTLWSGGPTAPEQGDAPVRLLPELRAALRTRDFARADEIGRAMQSGGWTQSYQPLGALQWDYADASDTQGYSRELDIESALATTVYDSSSGPVSLASFVSAPDAVMVAEATGTGVNAASAARLIFVSPHPGVTVVEREDAGVHWLVASGRAPANVLPNYVDQQDSILYADDTPDALGAVTAGMGFALVVAVESTGGAVRLIAAAVTGFRGFDQRPSADLIALIDEAEGRVAAARQHTTEELRERHVGDYRQFFDRVDLDLSDAVAPPGASDPARAELYFHYGRYLLISSSRRGTQAANLQGIWNVDRRPGWSSNYTTNINVQMNYWPAEATGLGELHEPLFALAQDLSVSGVTTAARYYGAQGAVVHHNTDLWRFSAPVSGDPSWANWPSALPWLAAHLWDHLDYSATSNGFATVVALPVHRAAVAFALDVLVDDGHGELVASPSTSPEHPFMIDDTASAAISEGAAMDQELIREVISHYLAIVEKVGPRDVDRELMPRAKAALDSLRPIQIGSNGALLEWADDKTPLELGHRHLSHLYGLYPGTRITESGTPEEYAAARVALDIRLNNGSGYTGWSQAWVLCLAARLRDPQLAEGAIAVLLDELSSDSLLDLHPHGDGFIFQIDGNFGGVAGMVELLVQSHEGAVSLLKTVPPSWSGGSVRGIRCRGGHRVDVRWAGTNLVEATLTAGPAGTVTVEVGTVETLRVHDGDGRVVDATESESGIDGRQRWTWAAEAGVSYQLTT